MLKAPVSGNPEPVLSFARSALHRTGCNAADDVFLHTQIQDQNVCIEPWVSLPSHSAFVEDITKQAHLIHLNAGDTYHY